MAKKVKGVEGWLLLFVIMLVFFKPAFSLYDIFTGSSADNFLNDPYSSLTAASITWSLGWAIWSMIVGIAVWQRRENAIIWAKEFLIMSTFPGVLFLFFFTFEEVSRVLFRGLLWFGIWFSYLSLSVRVRNTFKNTKLDWKRVGTIFIMVCSAIAIFLFLIFMTPSGQPNSEVDKMQSMEMSNEFTQSSVIDAETAEYLEFSKKKSTTDTSIQFKSTLPLTVFAIKSEEDFERFLAGSEFEFDENCVIENQKKGEITCSISSGGIVVWNHNLEKAEYSLTIT